MENVNKNTLAIQLTSTRQILIMSATMHKILIGIVSLLYGTIFIRYSPLFHATKAPSWHKTDTHNPSDYLKLLFAFNDAL